MTEPRAEAAPDLVRRRSSHARRSSRPRFTAYGDTALLNRSARRAATVRTDTALLTRSARRAAARGTIDCVIWLWVVALVVIIGAIAVVVAGRDDAMAEVYDDRPDVTLPTGRPLTADDIAAVRLSTGVRGYRMDEVDALLDRIQADLLAREIEGTPAAAAETSAEPPAGTSTETPTESAAETSAEPPDEPSGEPSGEPAAEAPADPPTEATAVSPTATPAVTTPAVTRPPA